MNSWHDATSLEHLLAAAYRAAKGKKQQPAVARFLMDAERECLHLQHALRRPGDHPDAWWPAPTDSFQILDPKPRTISVAPFQDRVVHHVICAALEPALERYSIHHSYACWKKKGQHRALRQCQHFARKADWALKGDVTSFFSSVPHDLLFKRVRRLVHDAELYAHIERSLGGTRSGSSVEPACGLPIGALTSQHLANFYLGLLDHWLTDGLGFGWYLRYMDDFIIFGTRSEMKELLPRLRAFLKDRMKLRLNERQSRVQPVRDGVPFLGFRVYPSQIRVSAVRWRRFRRRQQSLEEAYNRGDRDEESLGRALTSLYAHLQAFDTYRVRRGHLKRLGERQGRGRARLQPGDPGRLLEEQPAERARRQPQQERALQAQQQRGVSRGEFNAVEKGPETALFAGPVGAASRSGPLCPGIDQTPGLCSKLDGVLIPSSQPGTKPQRPGGGATGVAAGPFLRAGR